MLQSLLFIKKIGMKKLVDKPSLSIILTCWDELNTEEKPYDIFQRKLPMLLNFVETVWRNGAFEVVGLSAQEFSLGTSEAKEKYQNELPENFGYMVDHDGVRDTDLTKIVRNSLLL